MNYKSCLKILICFVLLLTIVVGFRNNEDPHDNNGPGSIGNGGHVHGLDRSIAMAAFEQDTVMMRAGDAVVTWAEFYFFLHNALSQLSHGFMMEVDWDEEFFDNKTIAESLLEFTTEHVLELLIYEYALSLLGGTLSQEDLNLIQMDIDMMIESAESMDFLEETLIENGFFNIDVYKTLRIKQEFIPWQLLSTLYGDDLTNISDAAVSAFAEEHNFMRAKHILLAFLREEDGYSLQEIDENKIVLRAQIEDILALLRERAQDDDFIEFFDEQMWAHSEDPGLFYEPDGYLFLPEDMVAPFSDATAAIKPGEISDIVVTSFGYHIVLRLPLNYDEVYAKYGYPLRMLAVIEDFENNLEFWRETMNVEFTDAYKSINFPEIFVWCSH